MTSSGEALEGILGLFVGGVIFTVFGSALAGFGTHGVAHSTIFNRILIHLPRLEENTMSEETARIYNRARRMGVSSNEAWEDLGELAEEIEWDVERMLSDPEMDADAVSDQDLPQ